MPSPFEMDAAVKALIFALVGYLSGSVLYARVFSRVFHIEDVSLVSRDGNPGTANAFIHGGFVVGALTLTCDIGKALCPVAAYMYACGGSAADNAWLPIVIAAPVLGHVFPIFYGFSGGKGIASSFGSLLGLYPYLTPVFTLAFFFIFFSVVVIITSHFHRTITTYICTAIAMFVIRVAVPVAAGFTIIAAAVEFKLLRSHEEKGKFEVRALWTR